MPRTDDPAELSPEQRFQGVARIFAAGVLRCRKLRLRAGEPPDIPQETSAETAVGRLEVSGETVLSVHTG